MEQQAVIQSITDIIKRQFVDNIIKDLTTQVALTATKYVSEVLDSNSSDELKTSIMNLLEKQNETDTYKLDRNSSMKQMLLNVMNLQVLGLLFCGSS